MDADELRKTLKRLDAMSERVDKVIGHERPEKPLRPDVSYPRSRRARNVPTSPLQSPVVASGPLTGNEMCKPNGYSPRSQQHDDCDPDGMWANFESEFDDMVAGMH